MNSLFSDQPVDDDKDFLSEFVGDGKKYKTPADLAKAYYHADNTIEILKREKDQLRKDYEDIYEDSKAKAKLETLIDQLNKQQQPTSSEQPKVNEDKPALSLEEYEKLVERKLGDHETLKKQTNNFNFVQEELQKRYGNRYQDVLKQHMKELGITEDFVDFNARNNPRALLKMLSDNQSQESFQAPPRPSRNPFPMKKEEKRTWSWYQNLKKDNPRLYRDPKTSVQMLKDYETLGRDFEDGDFSAGYSL